MTVIGRYFAKVDWPASFGACWNWTDCVKGEGYGKLRVGSRSDNSSRMVNAHRIAYELAIGPIPAGAEIDHVCRNRSCVNPLHLEAVPKRTNILRGQSPQAQNVLKTHCPQGHLYDEVNTKLHGGRRYCRACIAQRSAARRSVA